MTHFETEQEAFWAGGFGNEYTERNQGGHLLATNLALFGRILSRAVSVTSVLELGANRGMNLRAIAQLLPDAQLAAVEINGVAADKLQENVEATVYRESILRFSPSRRYDLVLSKGVLIHIAPDCLEQAYQCLLDASDRYICLVEYYNPVPVEVSYRGHANRLFKRDFAGDLLERERSLHLCDYGFVYHGDPVFPGDDLTWFLLEKK